MKEIETEPTEYQQTVWDKLEVLKNKINEIVQYINKMEETNGKL